MTILLDESVPRDLARALRALGCEVTAFPKAWKGTRNGRLLSQMTEAGHNVLLTCDKNMPYQQNITRLKILIAVLPYQTLAQLLPHKEAIARFLAAVGMQKAGVVHVSVEPFGTVEE